MERLPWSIVAARRAAVLMVVAGPLLLPLGLAHLVKFLRGVQAVHRSSVVERIPNRAQLAEIQPAGGQGEAALASAADWAQVPESDRRRFRRLMELAGSLPIPSPTEELARAERALSLYQVVDREAWEARLSRLPHTAQLQVRRTAYELLLVCIEHHLHVPTDAVGFQASLEQAGEYLRRTPAVWSPTPAYDRFLQRYAELVGDLKLAAACRRRSQLVRATAVDYYFAARQAFREGRPRTVELELARALQRAPDHLPSLRLWGLQLERQRAGGAACAVASALIALRPQDAQAYALRSAALDRMGLRREARADAMLAREMARSGPPGVDRGEGAAGGG